MPKSSYRKPTSNSCKCCNHAKVDEIDRLRIIEKYTYEDIAHWIRKDDPDERINTASVQRHFSKHVTLERELQIKYKEEQRKKAKSGKEKSDEVKIKLVELKHLDDSIAKASELLEAVALEIMRCMELKIPRYVKRVDDEGNVINKIFRYEEVKLSKSLVDLYKATSEEIRQSSKAKREILGMDASQKQKEEDKVLNLADFILSVKNKSEIV